MSLVNGQPGRSTFAAREQTHRRGALIAIAVLIVLSTSPVFGHHVTGRLTQSLAGHDHFLNICLVALHELLAPVHFGFHTALIAGALFALFDRGRAIARARGSLGRLAGRVPMASDPFGGAAHAVGVRLADIRIVTGLPLPAFTAGWVRPRIYVAAGLDHVLTSDELAAVLAHEQSHLTRRDPLRLFSLRALACLLFFIPALRRLADDLADEAEIIADDAAVASPAVKALALASAILALAKHQSVDRGLAVAVGFHRDELIERRIRRLAGEEPAIGTHVTRRSIMGAAAWLAAVWISGLIMAHPLPAATTGAAPHAGHGSHCQHHGAWPFSHLFCLGFGHHHDEPLGSVRVGTVHAAVSGAACPHAGL